MYRKKGLVLVLLMILSCGFALGGLGADTIEEVEGTGLLIRSVPSGARVYVDGIERGLTPLTITGLRPGEYDIRLKKEGYQDRRFKAVVRRSSQTVISVVLEEARGRLVVNVRPAPGSPPMERLRLRPVISVDGNVMTDPVLSLPVGYRTIRVQAFGWEEEARTIYVLEGDFRWVEFVLRPAEFRLRGLGARRSRFNPANSGSLGTAELGFEVSAPGAGRVIIEDRNGDQVFFQELPPFDTWTHWVTWDGRTWDDQILPDGTYRVLVEAESIPWNNDPPLSRRVEMAVTIDSSIRITPRSLSSGAGGLLFAPAPDLLPSGAFQLDGSLLFGLPPRTEGVWRALPFSAAFRFTPLPRLELAAALNVNTSLDDDAVAAVGGSLKWQFLEGGEDFPLGLAVGLSYGWTGQGALTAFGMDAGLKVFVPLSWHLGSPFDLILTPAIYWTGEAGYPSSAVPRALLSGGLLFQYAFVTAGLSLRTEYRFEGSPWFGPLLAGLEIRLFPPPSNFVISFMGGYWYEGSAQGGWGGLGIGVIY